MTSLGNIFTMEKTLVQNIVWRKNFICELISINFATLYKTFGMLKDNKIRFVSGCLRISYFAKWWFPKDCIRRVEALY